MAERAEEGMDNEKDCRAENDFLSPNSPLVDADVMDGSDEGMQKYVNGDSGVPGRKNGEPLPSPWQSNEAENSFVPRRENGEPLPSPRQSNEAENASESEDGFVPPLDQGSALPYPPDKLQDSTPIDDASEKGGLIDSKHAADIAPADMDPHIEGLEEIRQGETPVEIEQESAVQASAEIQHELDGELSVEAQSIASDLLETEQERQDLAQPEQGNTGDSELGEAAPGWEEYKIQEELVNDAAGTSFTTGVPQEAGDAHQQGAPELVEKDVSEVNSENSDEQVQDHSASEEFNEQVDLEIPNGNVSEPYAATVPDDALAMEALIDADNEEPSHEQDSIGTVGNSEQHMEASETHEEYVGGEDDFSLVAAESADKALIPSGQGLGTDIPKEDCKEELGNEPPLVFEQETEQLPINEAPSMELRAERELEFEAPLAVLEEPTEQSLDTAPSSFDLEMAADINEKGDEAVPLKADDTLNTDRDEVATCEVVEGDAITDSLEETYTENNSGSQALNGEQVLNIPHNKESDETFKKQLDAEGLPTGQDKSSVQMNDEALPSEGQTGSFKAVANIDAANGQLDGDTLLEANHLIENCDKSSSLSEPSGEREHEGECVGKTITTTQLESTADDISNGVLESSVTSDGANKSHISENMVENGDSLQSCPSRENGRDVEGSYVGHSTEPVFELGTVSDGTTEGEAPIMALGRYHGMNAEDDKQSTSKPLIYNNSVREDESGKVSEVEIQTAEAKGGDLDAGKGKEIVGGTKGVPSHTDATSTTNSLAQENGFLKHSEGEFEKESEAQTFHNERSREASLSLLVPQQRDRVSEHMERKEADHTNGRVTLARRTNWWGCCGMLDLLLHKA